MDISSLRQSLGQDRPPDALAPPLAALWWDAKGDWDRAHGCVDSEDGEDAAWAHAYLHRKEGDLGNAAYWYRQVGQTVPDLSLAAEHDLLVTELLAN